MAPIRICRLSETDIPGVVAALHVGFVGDPYNEWMYDEEKFDPKRNAASLAARCRWGMRNGLFYVAKEEGSERVVGVAMWLPPRPVGQPRTWSEWWEGWRFWANQVGVNLWYGRGGLNVKGARVVSDLLCRGCRPRLQGPLLSPVAYAAWPVGEVPSSMASGSRRAFLPGGGDMLTRMDPNKRYYLFKEAQKRAHAQYWTDPRGYYFLNIIVVLPEARGRGIGRDLVAVVTDQADREGMPCYLESSKDRPTVDIYKAWGFQLAGPMECDQDGNVCRLFCMTREPQPQPT